MKNFYIEKYKIIQIISEKEILVNYGYNDGAEEGDSLEIIEVGPEVKYNDISYGAFDLIKAEIEVVEVFDRFSLCKSFTRKNSPFASNLSAIGNPFGELLSPKIIENELNINTNQINKLKKPNNKVISLGDIVKFKFSDEN
ncbi:hypothetical protein [Helcococcus bovis]|uniref:hypothetical protein n=1 Tax=Helcococcus bovis TaxID=3153252 RepID=UPI0038B9FD8F